MAGNSGLGLKDLMRAVKQDLPITVRHERWLIANGNPEYSQAALDFARKVLGGEIGGKRTRRKGFRASGMGRCPRERLFTFLGVPKIEAIDSRSSNTFLTGNFMHLKWQMAGITEGWIPLVPGEGDTLVASAEVPLHSDEDNLGGTVDGFLYDDSLFEFKSINRRNYDFVTKNGPKWEHLLQAGAYKVLVPDLKAASIVYENKETGEWREYRTYFETDVMEAVLEELAGLNEALRVRRLPKMLSKCEIEEGYQFRQCPFRVICPKTAVWPKGAV